jgi:hypothetical protein
MLLFSVGFTEQTAMPQRSSSAAVPGVRGTVMNPITHEAIENAEILLTTPREAAPPSVQGKMDSKLKAITGADGAFSFSLDELGSYRVEARKPGWGPSSSAHDYDEVKLTAEEPVADVVLYLGQFGALNGSVIDGATGQPIPNFRLHAVVLVQGSARGIGSVALQTDSSGNFRAMGLPPGGYAVEALPQSTGVKHLLTAFTDNDLSVVDYDFEHSYWPGGHGLDAALPVQVLAGESASIGSLRVTKAPYYRVHVRIPASNCEPEDTVSVSENIDFAGSFSMWPVMGKAPCGKDILITGHRPGDYRLFLSIDGRDRENRATASVPFTVSDRNLSVTAPLQPGVILDGVVVAAERARPPDISALTIELRALDGQIDGGTVRSSPDSEGRFRITGVRPVNQAVMVTALPGTHYIKEMRYDGGPLGNWTLPLGLSGSSHTLTIVLDDKVATITGLVAVSGRPVSRPIVVAARWPVEMAPDRFAKGQSDETGRFQINGLAPGEYRVLAFSSLPRDPAVLSNEALVRLLASGARVELRAGEAQNITLEPVDPQ